MKNKKLLNKRILKISFRLVIATFQRNLNLIILKNNNKKGKIKNKQFLNK